jgi:hypothetical protein
VEQRVEHPRRQRLYGVGDLRHQRCDQRRDANRGLIGEIGLHDGKATSLSVDSLSSKTVLQGEQAEKNSTGTKHIDRRIMGVRQVIAADVFTLN